MQKQIFEVISSKSKVEPDYESEPSCDEEEDDFNIRISGAKGQSISLSYFASIPTKEDGSKSSHGSQGHPDKCIPCCFESRARGCADGILCNMCHDFHPKESYSRRKKTRVRKAKQNACDDSKGPEGFAKSPPVEPQPVRTPLGDMVHARIRNTFWDFFLPGALHSFEGQASIRAKSAP